jgi:hypothetical protein
MSLIPKMPQPRDDIKLLNIELIEEKPELVCPPLLGGLLPGHGTRPKLKLARFFQIEFQVQSRMNP